MLNCPRKEEVEKPLRELDSRILAVIDDIDRLSNEQICLIFRLVSAI
ncbi:P-loop NTPase fold protein [Oxobacter pfennigii]